MDTSSSLPPASPFYIGSTAFLPNLGPFLIRSSSAPSSNGVFIYFLFYITHPSNHPSIHAPCPVCCPNHGNCYVFINFFYITILFFLQGQDGHGASPHNSELSARVNALMQRVFPSFTSSFHSTIRPDWVPDEQFPVCHVCSRQFTLLNRRHHW
jgi:hypothetical protein